MIPKIRKSVGQDYTFGDWYCTASTRIDGWHLVMSSGPLPNKESADKAAKAGKAYLRALLEQAGSKQ